MEDPAFAAAVFSKTVTAKPAKMCLTYLYALMQQQALAVFSGLMVAALNFALKSIMGFLVHQERHASVSAETFSITWKLFIAQFTNTGILLLVVNANLHAGAFGSVNPEAKNVIGDGNFDDFDAQWYKVVGAGMCLQVVSVAVSSIIPPFLMGALNERKINKNKEYYSTTRGFEQLCVLPEFDLSLRVAQTLNIIWCVLFYSPGMPLLYCVGMFYCMMSYIADRTLLLWFCRKPPAYDAALLRLCTASLFPGLLIHSVFCCWMYGNQAVYPSDHLYDGMSTAG